MADKYSYLGAGLVVPFRRDGKDDFVNSVGIDMIQSSLTIILGTLCAGPTNDGEVPYNQQLGTLMSLLRHRNVQDSTTKVLATHYVLDAITRNEPRIKVKSMEFEPKPDTKRIILRLKYDVVKRDTTGINVIASNISQEIEI